MSSAKINKFYIVYKARYDLFLHSLYRQQFVPRVHPSSKLVVVACLCTIVYSRGEVCSHQGPGHLFSGKDCSVGAQHHQRSLVFHCKTERKSPVSFHRLLLVSVCYLSLVTCPVAGLIVSSSLRSSSLTFSLGDFKLFLQTCSTKRGFIITNRFKFNFHINVNVLFFTASRWRMNISYNVDILSDWCLFIIKYSLTQ